jgi:hypothetical protein
MAWQLGNGRLDAAAQESGDREPGGPNRADVGSRPACLRSGVRAFRRPAAVSGRSRRQSRSTAVVSRVGRCGVASTRPSPRVSPTLSSPPGGAALHHNPAGSSRGSGHLDPVEALLINLVGHAVLGFGRPPLYLAASPCDLPTDLRANVSITAKIHDLAEYRVCHVQHFALQQNSRRAGAETQRRLSIMKVARQI